MTLIQGKGDLTSGADSGAMAFSTRRRVLAGAVTVVLSIVSGFATFIVLTGLTPIVPTNQVVYVALMVNGALVFALTMLIAVEVLRLLRARRRGDAGAKLHGRVVGLFAVVSAVPAVLVAIFASVTLDRGLDRWFSGRTRTMIENSTKVAEAYLREHSNAIRGDMLAMASDLARVKPLLASDKKRFDEFVRAQMLLRALAGAYLITDNYEIITRHVQRSNDKFLVPPEFAMTRAAKGEAVVLTPGPADEALEVGGLMKLRDFDNTYLYVVRRLAPEVVQYLRTTQEQAIEYRLLEERRSSVQTAFALMYVGISLILLFSAIWTGLWFANRLTAPIRRLIGAAEQVSQGDLDIRVPVRRSEGELSNLGATFNAMTSQLKTQRDELVEANEQIDSRRRFSEAVLAGVTAGVVGLDENNRIEMVNRSAQSLLMAQSETLVGKTLGEAIPELESFQITGANRQAKLAERQVNLLRGGHERIVSVRVTTQEAAGARAGAVVTLDDITELVTAQRTSAWADIARRIAHEIKNPLTPIQLSAERLKRKYGAAITEDRHVFEQCTDTIIRQVGDIGRMVDEFSSFARMPKAAMAEADVAQLAREAAFLIGMSRPEIDIEVLAPEGGVPWICDRRLIAQAVTNLVKNATEAISAATMEEGEQPWIKVSVEAEAETAAITVTDNGCGLPAENRQRLLEPYMTTREKGTGLGLAIVRKIAEDHGGRVQLSDAPQVARGGHGASVTLIIPRHIADQPDAAKTAPAGAAKTAPAGAASSQDKTPQPA